MTTTAPPFPILRAGHHVKGGREVRVTTSDLDSAVANFEADKAAGIAVPLDYDHSFAEGRGSPASGWIHALFRRGAELFAEVEWTDRARELIGAGEYRGCSAEFARDQAVEDGTRRGFAVVGATLTNRPFLRDLTVAFSADRTTEASEHLAEIDALIETGDYNREACRHALATVRLMAGRNLDYADAAAAAYREEIAR